MSKLIKRGEFWWLETNDGKWRKFENKQWSAPRDCPPDPPKGPLQRARNYLSSEEGFGIYMIGLLAVFLAIILGWFLFNGNLDNTTKLLALVLPIIGTFTGHAAGHSAAASRARDRLQ